MSNIPTIIAGNWKMHCTLAEATQLAQDVVRGADSLPDTTQLVVCPPFTALGSVSILTDESEAVAIGGQDCSTAEKGAHTGDISIPMLQDCGCNFVIVGHSERRTNHGEDNALVKAKAEAALKGGLTPIICLGETLEQREAGETLAVITEQFEGSMPKDGAVVIAYEPVWAIGTGKVASVSDITEVHNHLRGLAGGTTPLLYGGSVKPGNAPEILAITNVNGALVGGASLQADDFLNIAKAAPVAVAA